MFLLLIIVVVFSIDYHVSKLLAYWFAFYHGSEQIIQTWLTCPSKEFFLNKFKIRFIVIFLNSETIIYEMISFENSSILDRPRLICQIHNSGHESVIIYKKQVDINYKI